MIYIKYKEQSVRLMVINLTLLLFETLRIARKTGEIATK